MPTLNLGVDDLPYVDPTDTPRKVPRKATGKPRAQRIPGTTTTSEVAAILEAKYHVMEWFFRLHEDEIAALMVEAVQGALEDLIVGSPSKAGPFGAATPAIKDLFKKFLTDKEMDGVVPGVPTAAAREGKSPRFKSGHGPARPSFVFSGLYEVAFEAWFEEAA